MFLKKTIILFIVSLIFIACNTNENAKKQKSKQKNPAKIISIKTDLFKIISPKIKENRSYNLFVSIDPHGNGDLAVNKFKNVSKEFNCIVIGLNNVKNNEPDFLNKIETDINYLKNNGVKIKNIFIAGFSGGARMALQYAINKNVSGLIMCGAGAGNFLQTNFKFNLVEISGTRDFNFIEQYYSPFSNLSFKTNLLSLSFSGGHKWPDNDLIYTASEFLLQKSNASINNYSSVLQKDSIEKYLEKADFLSFKKLETNYKISLTEESKNNLLLLLNSKKFKTYIKELETILQTEFNRNNTLVSKLETENFNWWKNQIDIIVNESEKNKNNLIADSYARTKAFIGILLYSKINAVIYNGKSKYTEKLLKIYKYAEPNNPDVKKFNDIYFSN